MEMLFFNQTNHGCTMMDADDDLFLTNEKERVSKIHKQHSLSSAARVSWTKSIQDHYSTPFYAHVDKR